MLYRLHLPCTSQGDKVNLHSGQKLVAGNAIYKVEKPYAGAWSVYLEVGQGSEYVWLPKMVGLSSDEHVLAYLLTFNPEIRTE